MSEYGERRASRDRRDWDVFVFPERRAKQERRVGQERRVTDTPYDGSERRQTPVPGVDAPAAKPDSIKAFGGKPYYSTAEVADATGLSQTTLLLWIRNKVIDGSRIKRSVEGRRLWTREDIDEIEQIKSKNGWMA